jgi:hypothetical protein
LEQHETPFQRFGSSRCADHTINTAIIFKMVSNPVSVEEDGGGALLAVKLSRLTARLDELQEQNGALIADKESLAAQVAALQQVGRAATCMHSKQAMKLQNLASNVAAHAL